MPSDDSRARFEALAADVVEPVRRYLARRTDPDTAHDVLAETLLVLWRRLADTPEDAVPWSIGIARGQLANATRGQRRHLRLVARTIAVDPPPVAAPSMAIPDDAESRAVAAAMGGLRPEDAELLRLWAWEELDNAGIGAVLGISTNAAAIRLHRARKRLHEALTRTSPGIGTDRVRRRRPSPTTDAPPPDIDDDDDREPGHDVQDRERPTEDPDRYQVTRGDDDDR